MKRGAPWYKRYPDDYLNGTRKLSLEARGAYADVLDLLYLNDGFIDNDEKWIAHRLDISTRKWRVVFAQLLSAEKLQILDGKISNARARDEIEIRQSQAESNRLVAVSRERSKRDSASVRTRTEREPTTSHQRTDDESSTNRSRTDDENQKKINKNNKHIARNEHHAHGRTRALETETETETESSAVRGELSAPQNATALPADLDELSERLFAACNGALDNPANCMGLLAMNEPRMWIDQGCDLDRDIIPTLVAAGKKYHGKRIRTWGYFTAMVHEAKQRRERGLPPVSLPAKKKFKPSRWAD